ncbi:uncharacterized protein MKS88_000184 [Plasmodium brasilianum]|uniref:uncharacterized protein n=1 Tax=Plasmodium brasilianum TaxID=5824 RepID=UPI00350E3E54|nr:hypothetical protein MKS88_000184 [Plasmodium brasilianum]
MESVNAQKNESCVELFLKYKKEFDTAINDILNKKCGENPGMKCGKIGISNFTTPCQDIGRYLIEIKELYKFDSIKRCKYLNYKTNSEELYINNPHVYDLYDDFNKFKVANGKFLIIMKFTPAKSWLYSRLQKRKIIERNEVSEETTGFLQNTYEKVNRTYEGSFNNLTYHPQGYS